MIEILHIINSLEIGGAQKLLVDILPLMNNEKMKVSLLVLKSVDSSFYTRIKNSGIEIFSLNSGSYHNPFIILRLIPFLRKFSIVHVHLFPSLYWVALANIFVSTKLIFTEHSTNNRRRGKVGFSFIERYVYRQYSKVISISSQTQLILKQWLKVNEIDSRFIQIDNGINLNDFLPSNKTINVADASQFSKIVLMISRFSVQKDQETVIRAIPYIPVDGVLFAFAGSGPTLEKCRQLAHELGVSDKVVFWGQRTDIPDLINASYIGVQSSFWEGFGLTAVEFMAGNKPIVASDVAGLKQVVEDAGLLFPAGDEKRLAEAITHLLVDKQYYSQVSAKCWDRAKRYDIHHMVEKYTRLYTNILSGIYNE
ncbi:glycosyltransferase [Bacteroides sp. GM023]|uniref:glycosyltransferase n=1 Tax=Bacteroides sp. GM023 TaxID=2723058 RepID=UPI001CC27DA4|nr:glycosyltransferase [Bacteroides sp. GM023]